MPDDVSNNEIWKQLGSLITEVKSLSKSIDRLTEDGRRQVGELSARLSEVEKRTAIISDDSRRKRLDQMIDDDAEESETRRHHKRGVRDSVMSSVINAAIYIPASIALSYVGLQFLSHH